MARLNKDQILKVDDRQIEEIEVPEWGGSVLVRGLDGAGRDAYFQSMTVMRNPGKGKAPQMGMDNTNATAKMVARCILDPDDPKHERLMFDSYKDLEELGAKSGAALNRVYEAALRLSGLDQDDMEELGKSSGTTPNGGSTSS